MTDKSGKPDLKALCEDVFTGVYESQGEKVINDRRALLFNEATKILYQAGYDDEQIQASMSELEEIIADRLNKTEDKAPPVDNSSTSNEPAESVAERHGTKPEKHRKTEEKASESVNSANHAAPKTSPPKNTESFFSIAGIGMLLVTVLISGAIGVALFYGGMFGYVYLDKTTNLFRTQGPELVIDGPSAERYEEAIIWCQQFPEDERDPDGWLMGFTPETWRVWEFPHITFTDGRATCHYVMKTIPDKVFSDNQQRWPEIKQVIFERLDEFRIEFGCELNLAAAPNLNPRTISHFNEIDEFVDQLNDWYRNEQQRFESCVQQGGLIHRDRISPFINDLYFEVAATNELLKPEMLTMFKWDVDIRELPRSFEQDIHDAQIEKHNQTAKQWKDYVRDTVEPSIEQAQEAIADYQQYMDERAEQKFRDKWGKSRNDICNFRGRQVRCGDLPPESMAQVDRITGWDDSDRVIGEMAEMTRQSLGEYRRKSEQQFYQQLDQFNAQLISEQRIILSSVLGNYQGTRGSSHSSSENRPASKGPTPRTHEKGCSVEYGDFGEFAACLVLKPGCKSIVPNACRDRKAEQACADEVKARNRANSEKKYAELVSAGPECEDRAKSKRAGLDGNYKGYSPGGSSGIGK